MTKSELIKKLAFANPHLSKQDVRKMVEAIFERLTQALENGERVELRSFGVFDVKWQGPRERRNPRTGKQVAVQGSYKPFFKYGKTMRAILNAPPTALTPTADEPNEGE